MRSTGHCAGDISADTIVVLDQSRFAETGTHDGLLACNDAYVKPYHKRFHYIPVEVAQ